MEPVVDLKEFLARPRVAPPESGQSVELCRGLRVRKNTKNPFVVATLRYEADPSKDPLTEEGKEWLLSQQKDMGCSRACRNCDKTVSVRDEFCPDCNEQTDLILSNKWRREYEIDYSAHSGTYVFDAFSRGRNTCDPFRIPASWKRWRVIDHGLRNPTACLWIAVDEDKNIWVYGEHYEAGQGVDYHAKQIHKLSALFDYHLLGITDTDIRWLELNNWVLDKELVKKCASVYRTIGDPSMGNKTQKEVKTIKHRYADNGLHIKEANRAIAGLETANTMFSQGRLTIFNNCVNTLREIESHVWAEHHDPALNKKERTVDRDDHTCDCLRYFVNAFAPAAEGERVVKEGGADMNERASEDRARFKKLRQRKINRNDHILDV